MGGKRLGNLRSTRLRTTVARFFWCGRDPGPKLRMKAPVQFMPGFLLTS